MISFYIARHGETLLNSLNRAQGWSDSPLTDNGKRTSEELGIKLKDIVFSAAYTSDMLRAVQTAKLILSASGNNDIIPQKDVRLREWCLGSMEAEYNSTFIASVSDWLGGITSFAELNKRLPDVAMAIYEHDTTGMAEPFTDISNRLINALVDIAHNTPLNDNSNILVVTHAFVIKTLFYLFAPEKLYTMSKLNNAIFLKLLYDGNSFVFEKT
ncbi:MAG: histidine phosphatase family protein [Lachnospiraceae bacterium]|nr:histidine phosphatase family protein [Lachnospiraceae bacterium]